MAPRAADHRAGRGVARGPGRGRRVARRRRGPVRRRVRRVRGLDPAGVRRDRARPSGTPGRRWHPWWGSVGRLACARTYPWPWHCATTSMRARRWSRRARAARTASASAAAWVHLRMCMTCGHVGCCDSSPARHATAHWHEVGPPGGPLVRTGRGLVVVLRRRGRASRSTAPRRHRRTRRR